MPSSNDHSAPHGLRARLQGLYVITDECMGGGHETIARAALHGGARIIQLRDKNTPLPALLKVAQRVQRLCRAAGALFLINDRLDIAVAVQADGVHLGPDDMPLFAARRVLGPHRVIGASCGTVPEAKAAALAGADYIGAGAIFGTATKADAGAAIGIDALHAIVAATPLPVAAIGGVSLANIAATRAAGARMACVVSAVAAAGDEAMMAQATRDLLQTFDLSLGSPTPIDQ